MSIPTPACLLCLSLLTLDNGSPHRSGFHLPTRPALWNLVFELSRPACQCIAGCTSWQPSIASATSSESLVVLQFRRSPARSWSFLLRDVLPCPCSPQPSHRPFTPRRRPSSYFCRVSHGPSLGRAQPPSAANTPTFRTPVSPRRSQTPLHPGAPIVPLHQSMPVNHTSGAAPVSDADVSTLETTTPSPSVQPSRPAPTYRQHQPVSLLLSSPSADRPPIACQSCFRSSTPKSLKCRFDHVLQCFRSSTPKSLGVELTTSSTSLYVPVQPPSNRAFHQRLERRKAHPSVLRPPC